ncbi:MAG: hypothetical protein KF745_10765 [Phycisphaeraceae bacterium]|nr:hypothetical protein [Phycisphaeraceae bacterium]
MVGSTAWFAAVVCASMAAAASAATWGGVGAAWSASGEFLTSRPGARVWTSGGGRVTTVYGEAFSTGASAEASAAAFVASHAAAVFSVGADELAPVSMLADGRATQPVMLDAGSGAAKFTLVYFSQFRSGYPVYMADLRLLVRNEPGFPLVLAKSALRDLGGYVPPREEWILPAGRAYEAAAALFGPKAFSRYSPTTLVIWAGVDDTAAPPALCYRFVAEGGVVGQPGHLKHLFLVDAVSGKVVHREDQVLHVDVTGSVRGLATPDANAAACSALQETALPYARVVVGGEIAYADSNGEFAVGAGAGPGPVVVESGVRGEFFRVFRYVGTAPVDATVLSGAAAPAVPFGVVHNAGGGEATTAEVNAYLGANAVRDHVLRYNPSFPVVAQQREFAVNVMVPGACNAGYTGDAINFYPAGGGCRNSAFGTVIYHEYGHHVVSSAGSGQGQYGEGFGDCLAMTLVDDPVLGTGLQQCSAGIRSAVNSMRYPCSGVAHTCGTLLSGCVWSVRNGIAAAHPSTYRDTISSLVINSVLLHQGTEITPLISIDFLTLDDDDANILNGTPHSAAISAGFAAHGMLGGCPADWDRNGSVDPQDVALFIGAWLASVQAGTLTADFDASGAVDPADIAVYVLAWLGAVSGGC